MADEVERMCPGYHVGYCDLVFAILLMISARCLAKA